MGVQRQTKVHVPAAEHEPRAQREEPVATDQPAALARLPGGAPSHRLPTSPAARLFRQAAVVQLQRAHGNAFVGQWLNRLAVGGPVLQRHPEGAAMTHDPAEAAVEIDNPPPLPAGGEATAADGAAGTAGTAAPEGASTEPATGEADSGEADVSAAAGGKEGTPPAPATAKVMDLKKAEEVLTKAYGTTKKIVPGKIVMLKDREATWKKYDEVNKGRQNPYNGKKPWKDGDAKKYIPGLDGFAEKGTVWVNQETKLATATAHEMLHNNTAAGFRSAVGETINEGATEYLAIKALKASGVSTDTGAVAYPDEVAFVTKLIVLVGEDTLIAAYFKGAATLTNKFDKLQGKGAFAKMKPFAESKNWTEANKLVQYNPTEI